MNVFQSLVILLISLLFLPGYGNQNNLESSQVLENTGPEEAALAAYSSLLSGDRTVMADAQGWIPDFQVGGGEYEYTYLDLDGDGVVELLVQHVDIPCLYNGVFHFENDKIFCWNSDSMELSCWDYPLNDGTMVRQYNHGGSSYTIFRYGEGGEMETIAELYVRKSGDSTFWLDPGPYYKIDGNEVIQAEFYEQFDAMVTSRTLNRSDWTVL